MSLALIQQLYPDEAAAAANAGGGSGARSGAAAGGLGPIAYLGAHDENQAMTQTSPRGLATGYGNGAAMGAMAVDYSLSAGASASGSQSQIIDLEADTDDDDDDESDAGGASGASTLATASAASGQRKLPTGGPPLQRSFSHDGKHKVGCCFRYRHHDLGQEYDSNEPGV